jgi:DUF4097 and DUF4098 domain-containing protein YvlB
MNIQSRLSRVSIRHPLAALSLIGMLGAPLADAATRTVNERVAAESRGSVEIVNTSGRVSVTGWDRPEVTVTGTLEEGVERLEVSSSGGKTVIRVIQRKSSPARWKSGEAVLDIRVPTESRLNVAVVSADLDLRQLRGEQILSTVSGDVDAELGAEAAARTVSGDLRLAAKAATRRLEISTASGDVKVSGSAGGRVEVRTVSGDAEFALGSVTDAEFKSVSGNLALRLALEPTGRLAVESVSGTVDIDFASPPAARFQLRSFSGGIDLCPGVRPKTSAADGGDPFAGQRREFQSGDGQGRVEVQTMSGDIKLCVPGQAR